MRIVWRRRRAKFGVKVGLVGCHGQTVYHQGVASEVFRERMSVDVADG